MFDKSESFLPREHSLPFHISRIINTQQDMRIIMLLMQHYQRLGVGVCVCRSLGKNIHCRGETRRSTRVT